MTIINPNSISGISSITALNSTAAINLFKADGTSANIIAGVTTGSNFITGTSNVHSTGYECTNINASGIITATSMDMISTDAGSSAAPEFKLYRNSASPADADYLGQIKFAGESDTGVERNYAKITGKILDASNGTEDGIIEFAHIKNGSQTITGRWRSDSLQLLNGTNFSVAGTSTFNGDITGAAGVDLNLDSTLGHSTTTTYSGFNGRLVFDTHWSDTSRGPNKIQMQNWNNTWIGGFGISSNTLDIYTGGNVKFSVSSGVDSYATSLTLDGSGNLSPEGDLRLKRTGGSGSTAVTDAAWGRLEFDGSYNTSPIGPNKILLQTAGNWFAGLGISQNSFDVYTGGILHFYGKTDAENAANKETLAKFITDGAVELYHNNTKRFETFDNNPFVGISVTNDVVLNGSGDTAYRWAVGGNASSNFKWSMYNSNSDGALRIYDNVNSRVASVWKNDGTIELNHSGTKVVETTGSGLKFNQTSGNLIKYGTTSEFPHAAINIYRGGNGYANIRLSSNYGCGLYLAGANNNTDEFSINQDNQKNGYVDNRGGFISFNTGSSGTQRMKIENNAQITFMGNLFPSSDNSYDIGSGAKRWRNIYTADLHCSNKGSSNDVDGTWGDYTIQEGESDLFLINNRSGKKYKFNLTEVS